MLATNERAREMNVSRPASKTLKGPFWRTAVASSGLAFAVSLFLPALFKIWKTTAEGLTPSEIARTLVPDVATAVGTACFALLTVFLSARHRWLLWVTTPAMTMWLVLLLGLSVLEHQTWLHSATLLDWTLLSYSLRHYEELQNAVGSEFHFDTVGTFLAATLMALAPALLEILKVVRHGSRTHTTEKKWAFALFSCLLVFGALSTALPSTAESNAFSRSVSVQLLADAVRSLNEDRPNVSSTVGRSAGQRATAAIADATDRISATGDSKKLNVMLVVLESTRYDATEIYAPGIQTTPNLTRLAERALIAETAYADIPHTSKALVSIHCGRSPTPVQEIVEADPGGIRQPCLGHILHSHGYRTAWFQTAKDSFERRPSLVKNLGLKDFVGRNALSSAGFEPTNYLGLEDDAMLEPILDWVGSNDDRPFFVNVLTTISHHGYQVPSSFRKRKLAPSGSHRDYNLYLNSVRYADRFIGKLVKGLEERGVLQDTILVVVGDHGQAFNEHGRKYHNDVIYEEGLRVPLLIYAPSLYESTVRVGGLRRQADIAPTILSAMKMSWPTRIFEGKDLSEPEGHDRIYASCWYENRCMAEYAGQTKTIHNFRRGAPEVYDLGADPTEENNLLRQSDQTLASAEGRRARLAIARMLAWKSQRVKQHGGDLCGDQSWNLETAPEPGEKLNVDFGGAIRVLGFDASTRRVQPGGTWSATLYLECLKSTQARMTGTLSTVDRRKSSVVRDLAGGCLQMKDCEPGTFVLDPIRVSIPADFPDGKLIYSVGAVQGRKALRPDAREGQDDAEVVLATLQSKALGPRGKSRSEALHHALQESNSSDKSILARFGENLILQHATVEPSNVRQKEEFRITTHWRVEGPNPGGWRISASYEPERGRAWNLDHSPVGGLHPIHQWRSGTVVKDVHRVFIGDNWSRGDVEIWTGIAQGKRRMPITESDGMTADDTRGVLLGTIRVSAPRK